MTDVCLQKGEPMDDLISRRAVIDAIDVLCQEHRYKIPGKRETYSQYNEAWQDALDRAEGAIFNLPSVQPDHIADIGKKASISCGQENDLISRQATIDLVGDWIYNPEDLRYHKDVINSIPAAQPEIVRCKDCKHWDTEWSVSESGAHYCPMVDGNRNSDFYCADAERRTDG